MYLSLIALVSKKNLLMIQNCILFHLRFFNIDPNAMLKTININVDNEFAPFFKTHKKVVININRKFQKI
jgi:uncharacterized protein YabE (DUF348 family)